MAAVSLSAKVFSSPTLGAVGPRLLEFISAHETAKIRRVCKRFCEMTPQVADHQLANRTSIDFTELSHYRKLLNKTFVEILNKMPSLRDLCFYQSQLFLRVPKEKIDYVATVSQCQYRDKWTRVWGTTPKQLLAIAKECPALEYFHHTSYVAAWGDDISDADVLSISSVMPNIRTVGIGISESAPIDPNSLRSLLKQCPQIDAIEIGIDNEFPAAFCDVVAEMGTRLKSLRVHCFKPISFLEKILESCPEIRHLEIDTVGDIKPILKRLTAFKKLETLKVELTWANFIPSDQFIPFIENCPNLRVMDLYMALHWDQNDFGRCLIAYAKDHKSKVIIYSKAGVYNP